MRMRKKKNMPKRLSKCAAVMIENPTAHYAKWHEVFQNDNPIHIEIGCGKGKFIFETAQNHPDINFIAVEKCKECVMLSGEKIIRADLPNVRVIFIDASMLAEVFQKGECERIYLNFSDPWVKKRHAKRRLTHSNFLSVYQKILPQTGEIFFKTDKKDFFDFSVEEFIKSGYTVSNITYDLHNSGFPGNVTTEYEDLFSSQGVPICRLEARFKR